MRKYITLMQMTANQLKEKRKGLNLTQKEFAEFIGVSKSTVERWETATQPITGPVVQLLQVLTPEYLASITVPPRELPFRLWYMYKDEVCTLIDVHEGKQIVKIYNYTKNVQFRVFGSNENPSFQD